MRTFFTVIVSLLSISHGAFAFSTGPGECPLGSQAATGHVASSTTSGSLSNGGFTFSVGGQAVSAGGTATVSVGQSTSITVSGATFKGFLIRVNNQSASISAGSNAGIAAVCGSIPGIGHTNNNGKSSAGGTITFSSAASNVAVDVTVVVQYAPGVVNEYYYSSFRINAASNPPPVAPVRPPTVPAPTPVRPPPTPVRPVLPTTPVRPAPTPVMPVLPTTPVMPAPAPSPVSSPSVCDVGKGGKGGKGGKDMKKGKDKKCKKSMNKGKKEKKGMMKRS